MFFLQSLKILKKFKIFFQPLNDDRALLEMWFCAHFVAYCFSNLKPKPSKNVVIGLRKNRNHYLELSRARFGVLWSLRVKGLKGWIQKIILLFCVLLFDYEFLIYNKFGISGLPEKSIQIRNTGIWFVQIRIHFRSVMES